MKPTKYDMLFYGTMLASFMMLLIQFIFLVYHMFVLFVKG